MKEILNQRKKTKGNNILIWENWNYEQYFFCFLFLFWSLFFFFLGLGAPLPSADRTFPSPTSKAAEKTSDLLQCGLSKPTARSHFPLPRSQQNKLSTTGRQTQLIHNHVLKPKPTICCVCHTLGKAWWIGTDVSYQDNHNEALVPPSICNEEFEDLRGSWMTIWIIIPLQWRWLLGTARD